MSYDFFAYLDSGPTPARLMEPPYGLASGFVDRETTRAAHGGRLKKTARLDYLRQIDSVTFDLPLPRVVKDELPFDDLMAGWLMIEVSFTLQTPWYSKDDRPFHVLDNPVRKDRVFGVPFMAAASWKGLLRWALAMTSGLIGPSPMRDEKESQAARVILLHLFGNEKGEASEFHRGALVFYPTWFDRIGFEVINPHSRETRAGTQPIYYEVVPPETKGKLRLLYAPFPGRTLMDDVEPREAVEELLDAVHALLTVYGFSAKRTAGWGVAQVDQWMVCGVGSEALICNDLSRIKDELPNLLQFKGDKS